MFVKDQREQLGAPPPPRPGPHLVPPRQPKPHSPLTLWHLLSLDAPTVAALWTLFIARCSHVLLPWPEPAAMFLAVWIIYAADRLLDARIIDTQTNHDLEPRHLFHHHHRTRFLTAIVIAALTLVSLLTRIDPRALHLYALLATLLSIWMLLIHARPQSSAATHRLPKELAVGIFFAAAIFIPTIARNPSLRPTLLAAAILFSCICTLNCLYLYAWEHPTPTARAHFTTRWAITHLTEIATALLTISTLTIAARSSAITLPATACALATTALILLNAQRHRLSSLHLRAAADVALLTPLFLLPFTR